VQECDEGSAVREPDRGLAGGVAPAHDRDARRAAELRLGRPGRVEDADPFVVALVVDRQAPV